MILNYSDKPVSAMRRYRFERTSVAFWKRSIQQFSNIFDDERCSLEIRNFILLNFSHTANISEFYYVLFNNVLWTFGNYIPRIYFIYSLLANRKFICMLLWTLPFLFIWITPLDNKVFLTFMERQRHFVNIIIFFTILYGHVWCESFFIFLVYIQ